MDHGTEFSTRLQATKSQHIIHSITHNENVVNEALQSQKTTTEKDLAYHQHHNAEKSSADATPAVSTEDNKENEQSHSLAQDNLEEGDLVDRSIETAVDTREYPSTWKASLLTIGLCLVTFATAVDNTIIGMVLLHSSYSTVLQ